MMNIRLLQPLVAPLPEIFDDLPDKMKSGFWKLGTALLNLLREGTLFDTSVVMHPVDSADDNFDVIHSTAEKLFIIRPLLNPSIIHPIDNELRKHVKLVFNQCVATLYPQNTIQCTQEKQDSIVEGEDGCEELSWLQKYRSVAVDGPAKMPISAEENKAESDGNANVAVATGTGKEDVPIRTSPKIKVKRRLMRRESDFDVSCRRYVPKNQSRGEMFTTATSICDMALAADRPGLKLSTVLDNASRYEIVWVTFPRDASSIKAMSAEKLGN